MVIDGKYNIEACRLKYDERMSETAELQKVSKI